LLKICTRYWDANKQNSFQRSRSSVSETCREGGTYLLDCYSSIILPSQEFICHGSDETNLFINGDVKIILRACERVKSHSFLLFCSNSNVSAAL